MRKILLVFINNLVDVDGFDLIINKFDNEGYDCYLYENIDDTNFNCFDLNDIVSYYKEQESNLSKIVVMSNIRDLLLFWFRCYNSIVDDFVYFVDQDENDYFKVDDKYYNVYYNIFEFNGIKNEIIKGSIYITERNNIILPLFYETKYVELFENFVFNNKVRKNPINKTYDFDDIEITVQISQNAIIERVKIEKINKRILFIKGQSQYNALRIAIDDRMLFYEKLGFEVDLIDLCSEDYDDLDEKLNKKAVFIYSANGIGVDIKCLDGRNIYDAIDTPCIVALGDHPVHHFKRIVTSPKKTLFTCIDYENLVFFEKNFPSKHIITNYEVAYKSTNYKEKSFKDRKIDIIFAGTIKEPDEIKKSWKDYDPIVKTLIESLGDRIISSKEILYIDKEMEEFVNTYALDELTVALLHSEIEFYIRNYKRYHMVKKLGESGLSVLCIGNVDIFSKLNVSGKLIIQESIDYQALLELYNDCKVLINMTGHLYNGVTERIVSAMINGTAVITEKDLFTSTHFIEDENIIFYDFHSLDKLITKVNTYFNDINKLEQIAINGQKVARNYDIRKPLVKFPRMIRRFDNDSKTM